MTLMTLILILLNINDPDEKFLINKIEIKGNESTLEYVIRREILFSEGEVVSRKDIKLSLKRIENLGIFNSVLYFVTKDNDAYKLTYKVIERLNLFILPQVIVNTDRGNKFSYGLKVKHANMFGRNVSLNIDILLGFRPGYRFSMSNPWFGGDNRYFYSFGYSNFEGKQCSI